MADIGSPRVHHNALQLVHVLQAVPARLGRRRAWRSRPAQRPPCWRLPLSHPRRPRPARPGPPLCTSTCPAPEETQTWEPPNLHH